ncbi:MAG: DUF5916 domain-containing protein [bacterium]
MQARKPPRSGAIPAVTTRPRANAATMLTVICCALASLVLAWWSSAIGQHADEAAVESIAAFRTNNHPKIDGEFGDHCWQYAARVTNFLQHEPEDGNAPTESTAVQVAYDDDAVYVAMQMYDSEPDKIVSRLTRRDRDQDADAAAVVLDSFHDHQTGYMFQVYASGTQQDAYFYNDNWQDNGWDAVWESATRRTDDGWTAEFKIPLDCLRFSATDSSTWGILCSRWITRKQEQIRWPYFSESASGFVSNFGHLTGMENLKPKRQLEVLPYAVSYQEREATHPGNPDGRRLFGNAGVDLKYGVTPNVTLNATFNPDFGQVEADLTSLNLTQFETFYTEKRPFFLEGLNIFSTYYDLFYSRRVGRAPSRPVWDAVDFVDKPGATTILGAAKLTGRTSGGTTIGIMEAATQRETATYLDSEEARKKAVVEPEANYFVARIAQDVMRNSRVGIMATAANQKTAHPAYTGGVDWILRGWNGYYSTHGQIVGSATGRDHPGWGGFLRLAREGGEHLRANLDLQQTDCNLDLNRIGYLRRNGIKEASGWVQYRNNTDWWIVNQMSSAVYADLTANLAGLRQNYGMDIDNHLTFKNFWFLELGAWLDFGTTDFDWETRGGPPVPIPTGQSWRVELNTDERKWWELNPYFGAGDTWDGGYYMSRLWVNLRPRSNIEMSFGPGYREEWDVSRWLTAVRDDQGVRQQEIFGEQDLKQFDMTVRGTFTFTRDLTLQVYAQPFIAAVDYNNFKRLLPDETYQPVDATVYDESVERPDFNWRSFNSNVIVRWEYLPGSTLYMVWTQTREGYESLGSFKFDRDLRGLFDNVPGNTFLVKASYRLGV